MKVFIRSHCAIVLSLLLQGGTKAAFRIMRGVPWIMEAVGMITDEANNIVAIIKKPGREIGLKFLCCSSEPHSEY